MKITFMGAGSTIFAKYVIGDSMLTPALRESEFALYDILEDRLEESYMMVTALNKNINENRAKITKYLGVENRKAALKDADFVITDHINVYYHGSDKIKAMLDKYYDYVMGEVLGEKLIVDNNLMYDDKLNDEEVAIKVERV